MRRSGSRGGYRDRPTTPSTSTCWMATPKWRLENWFYRSVWLAILNAKNIYFFFFLLPFIDNILVNFHIFTKSTFPHFPFSHSPGHIPHPGGQQARGQAAASVPLPVLPPHYQERESRQLLHQGKTHGGRGLSPRQHCMSM